MFICIDHSALLIRNAKIASDHSQQAVHLLCGKCCRCTSADINRIQYFMLAYLCREGNFFFQCIQIFIHAVRPFCQRIGGKRAIQTGARTKRNAHIQTVSVLIINTAQQFQLPLCNRQTQLDFFIRSKVCFLHIGTNLIFAFSLLQKFHRNLRRADTGQSSPRKCLSCIHSQQVIQLLL